MVFAALNDAARPVRRDRLEGASGECTKWRRKSPRAIADGRNIVVCRFMGESRSTVPAPNDNVVNENRLQKSTPVSISARVWFVFRPKGPNPDPLVTPDALTYESSPRTKKILYW